MNALTRLARNQLVLLINDDVILDPFCLDRAIAVLQEHPEAGMVGGLLRTSDGRLAMPACCWAPITNLQPLPPRSSDP